MSMRRSLSFAEDEQELLEYFDTHGKSDIAKIALDFYRKYKDRVIPEGFIEILKLVKSDINTNQMTTIKATNKMQKLIK